MLYDQRGHGASAGGGAHRAKGGLTGALRAPVRGSVESRGSRGIMGQKISADVHAIWVSLPSVNHFSSFFSAKSIITMKFSFHSFQNVTCFFGGCVSKIPHMTA